ncbi:MAG: hypothetical protein IK116_04340, partial [Firmicutes bacterium]|nr:hypothetical protein [Bacillota bacterium]
KSTLSSGTKATYSMTVAEKHDGWKYYCVVKDSHGNSVKSSTVTLTVKNMPVITAQPEDYIGVVDAKAKFKVTASGSGSLTYQWYVSKDGGSTWAASTATGNKTSSISVTIAADRDGWQYYCRVTDGSGNSVKSRTATLTVGTAPVITSNPYNMSIYEGYKGGIRIKATGSNVTYQWQEKYPGGDWADSTDPSAHSDLFITPVITQALEGYQYRCQVTSAGVTVCSNVGTMHVVDVLEIVTQPTSGPGNNADGTRTLYCGVTGGEGNYSYFWYSTYFSQTGEFEGYYLNDDKAGHIDAKPGAYYYCYCHDSSGHSVTSDTVYVGAGVYFATQPVGGQVDYPYGTKTLSVQASGGSGGFTYQWMRKGVDDSEYTAVSGAVSTSITAQPAAYYYCVVTDGSGARVNSDEVLVSYKLYVAESPIDGKLVNGVYTLTAEGGGGTQPYSYQWLKDGYNIPGATSASYRATEPGNYKCTITDSARTTVTTGTAHVDRGLYITSQPTD